MQRTEKRAFQIERKESVKKWNGTNLIYSRREDERKWYGKRDK